MYVRPSIYLYALLQCKIIYVSITGKSLSRFFFDFCTPFQHKMVLGCRTFSFIMLVIPMFWDMYGLIMCCAVEDAVPCCCACLGLRYD